MELSIPTQQGITTKKTITSLELVEQAISLGRKAAKYVYNALSLWAMNTMPNMASLRVILLKY